MTMFQNQTTASSSEPQQSAPAADVPASPPGYQLLDEIGRGGLGAVYLALDVALGRDVAVKLLSDRFAADSLAARRFVNEARITATAVRHALMGGIPDWH